MCVALTAGREQYTNEGFSHLVGSVGPVPGPGVGLGLGVFHLALEDHRVAHVADDGLISHLPDPRRWNTDVTISGCLRSYVRLTGSRRLLKGRI